MKKIIHSIRITVVLLSFVMVYGCTQTENHKPQPVKKSRLEKITGTKPVAGVKVRDKIRNEIAIPKQSKPTPTRTYSMVLPGRITKSAVFMPGKQNILHIDGATLTVCAGSITKTSEFSVTGLTTDDLPPVPAEITNVTQDFNGYRFLPHGMLFDSAAIISIDYNEALIPEGYTREDIYTYYFDETDRKWKALERNGVDSSNHCIVSNTLHFTDMINGIIKVPESPETAGYTPTSIKDIKAADPSTGISMIAPPSATSEGDAGLSFPFKLPGGRAGMQPQLGLQYSSEGGSSWAGFGWGLSVPGISVDANWGVPHYYSDKESETYSMGESQLTPVAHRSEYAARTAEKRFYPRIEGGFSKIIRHGNSPTNYWWEVTSKEGD
jgi:hypothetical protein